MLRLFGNSTDFQGTNEVVEGTLIVDGALGGASHQLDASNGGVLAGTGLVGGMVAMLDARLAPGNGVGVLTIDGDLTLDATSILDFELDQPGDTNDRLVVNGDLHLDGTLQVADQGGYGRASTFSWSMPAPWSMPDWQWTMHLPGLGPASIPASRGRSSWSLRNPPTPCSPIASSNSSIVS